MARYVTTMDMYARAFGPELGTLTTQEIETVQRHIFDIFSQLVACDVMQRRLSRNGDGINFNAIRMPDSAEKAKSRPAFLFQLNGEGLNLCLCLPCGSSPRGSPGVVDMTWMYQGRRKVQFCDTWSMVAVPQCYVTDDGTTMQATAERGTLVRRALWDLYEHILEVGYVRAG